MTISRRALSSLAAVTLCLAPALVAAPPKTLQVQPNHMRWDNHDAVITHAIAWQEERDKHWVTIVLVTDRAIPRAAVVAGKTASDLMTDAKAQGVGFAVMSGGILLPESGFEVGFHDAPDLRTTRSSGGGGIEIAMHRATQIKGSVVYHPFTAGEKDETAWSIVFDAPILRGDAKRMAAEGEALGPDGGAAGKDLLALQQAKLAMDFTALSAVGSAELAGFLKDPGGRAKNLAMLKSMTSPQSKVLGGLRTGDKALAYWTQIWPAALDNRCLDTLELKDGRWRSTGSVCQAE